MEKIVERAVLYDYYGCLLNEHQQRIYEEVVFQDLSLAEIAEETGVSRQGVHDLIRRCDRILEEYERKLHLIENSAVFRSKLDQICEISSQEEVRRLAGELKTKLYG